MNILDLLKSQLGTQGIGALANMLGESESNTQLATNSTAATILATLMQQAGSNNGAGAAGILDMVTKGASSAGLLGNITSLLGDNSQVSNLTNSGTGILSSLLGNKVGGIAELISNISGIKSSSANSLMSMVAPMLLGLVGKQVGNGGVSGLMNLLMGQSDFVKAALPTGLASMIGFNNFDASSVLNGFMNNAGSGAKNAVNTATNTIEEAASASTNWLPWILGALGLLAALWYFKGCGDKSNELKNAAAAAEAKARAAKDSLEAYTKKMAADASNALSSFKFNDGSSISFSKGSIEDQMIAFINDKAAAIDKNKWFNFEGLNFDTNKATLMAGSEAKLANVAAIMKAFPAVTIKIGGYTDNVGKPENNKGLSDARAKTVMAELVKLGVDAKRMTAEGYGQEHPVADNATEEGRAKNRRIDISVRTK